jgi:rubrerythrin
MNIRALMSVPRAEHDSVWLKKSLQAAVALEFATIPPYLCALWSIKDASGEAYDRIRRIIRQEMLHMGLACNMLTTIGETPDINSPSAVPKYPGHLPGGVKPTLEITLQGLSKDVVHDIFMQIEYPENGPVRMALEESFESIGAFYDAIRDAFKMLPPASITGARQLTSGGIGLTKITSMAEVENAILKIKEQGEGTSQSPFATDFGGELAHYYKFGEIFHGQTYVKGADGTFDYKGTPVPFPDVFPMSPVPDGGYPESRDFDLQFTAMLADLQDGWASGNPAKLTAGVNKMRSMGDAAQLLMQKPLPGGQGNFGPSFRLVT